MTDLARVYPLATSGTHHDADQRWVAVWTKPRAEKVVATALVSRCDRVWLPTVNVRRRWSDRWKEIEMPLFPGYLFAETTARDWPALLRIPGVLTIVKQGRRPAWIRDHQMGELQLAVARMIALEGIEPELVDDYEAGERVRVVSGPMAGLVGVIREVRGSRRLLVGFEQIGRAVGFSIGAADVERCDPPIAAAS